MIEFLPEFSWSLFDHFEMKEALEKLGGRSVDLLTKNSVDKSRNPLRKNEILNSVKAICESAS